MQKVRLVILALRLLAILMLFSVPAYAWNKTTHKIVAQDALAYMGSSYATPEMRRAYDVYVSSAGSFAEAAELLGNAALNVDNFMDTALCGWWVFGCHYTASDLTLGLAENNYTSWWHFETLTRGRDIHGNPHGGYNYQFRTNDNDGFDEDLAVATFLWNQNLSENSYNVTEARYRQGTYSTFSMYEDFQSIPWQPITNLARYWYDRFKDYSTFQRIGYVLHSADLGVAQHVWNTVGNKHADYESWVQDHYYSQNLRDFSKVSQVIREFRTSEDVRTTLSRTANQSYYRFSVLYDTSSSTRLQVAREMIPRSIAQCVILLTKGINFLYGEE